MSYRRDLGFTQVRFGAKVGLMVTDGMRYPVLGMAALSLVIQPLVGSLRSSYTGLYPQM